MKSLFFTLLLTSISLSALAQTPENITFGVGVTYLPISIPGDAQYFGGNFSQIGLTDFFVPMQNHLIAYNKKRFYYSLRRNLF